MALMIPLKTSYNNGKTKLTAENTDYKSIICR